MYKRHCEAASQIRSKFAKKWRNPSGRISPVAGGQSPSLWIVSSAFVLLAMTLMFTSTPSALAMARRHKTFPIDLKVDFGPAGKPGFEDPRFLVEKGATAKEVVALMDLAFAKVKARTGVELVAEVKRVGRFE